MSIVSKKICLVGDFGVGKTSLIRRFVDRQFSDQYLSTVGVKISRKLVEVLPTHTATKQDLQLLIWDIEGSTKFKAIAPTYLQGAKGALLVADVTRPETLEHLSDHINLFGSINPQASIIIALNKIDLIEQEKLEKLVYLNQFHDQNRVLATYTTSAKVDISVDEIFQTLAKKMMEKE
jgi:small GTP-binding protein